MFTSVIVIGPKIIWPDRMLKEVIILVIVFDYFNEMSFSKKEKKKEAINNFLM